MNVTGAATVLNGVLAICVLFVVGGGVWLYYRWRNSKLRDGWMDEGDKDV